MCHFKWDKKYKILANLLWFFLFLIEYVQFK